MPVVAGCMAQIKREGHLAVGRERILEARTPHLEKARKRKELTAWVAIDDDTALLVLDFLRRRGWIGPRRMGRKDPKGVL